MHRLFSKGATEYDLLSDIQKAFEPYCDLWKRVDDWMGWHKSWMNGSFLSLDAEEVFFLLLVEGFWATVTPIYVCFKIVRVVNVLSWIVRPSMLYFYEVRFPTMLTFQGFNG